MKISSTFFAFALLVMIAFSAMSAHAQTSYRFELFGAGDVIPTDKQFDIGPPQFTDPLQTGASFWKGEYQTRNGVRGGIRFGTDGQGHWGQDFIYSYGHNTAKIIVYLPQAYHAQPFGLPNPQFAFTSRSHLFSYNALFYPGGLRGKGFHPYLTAGVGAAVFTMSQNAINDAMFLNPFNETLGLTLGEPKTHISFAFNAGAGIRYQFNKNWGLRLDWRDWMSHTPGYGIPQSSTDPHEFVLPVKGVFHQLETSIGFVYFF